MRFHNLHICFILVIIFILVITIGKSFEVIIQGFIILFHKLIFSNNFVMHMGLCVKNQIWHRDNDLSLENVWTFRMDQSTDGALITWRHLYSDIWQSMLCVGW